MRSTTRRFMVLVFLLLTPILAFAQARLTGADLQGVVRDESGGVVPGVTVTATSTTTNQSRSAVSDSEGKYYIPALNAGVYSVSAELSGFAPQSRRDVRLQLGQRADLDFTMRVGATETIVVSAASPVVDTTSADVSTVVSQEQIDSLPTNGRNFLSFSVLTPGVTNDRTPQQGASATSGLSFGGQRARSNNIMVDGVDNNDPIVGAVRATFSQEAIQEFQVLTNSYSAEFGKASGGVVNIITRSGTNDPGGNLFYFYRDESLNSKSIFEKEDIFGNPIEREKAPYGQDQYGATFGGPIVRDRTFFFLSAENLGITASNFVTINPTAAALLNAAGFPVELGNVPYEVESQEYLAKIDHQWSQSHNLTGRINYAKLLNENIEPFGGITARSRGASQDRKDWSLALSETDVLSSRWVNELRGQYAAEDQLISSLDPSCNGICDDQFEGGPTVEIVGVASVGRQRFTPQPRDNVRYQLKDTINFAGTKHFAKAGFDWNYIETRETALPLHFGGRFIFQAIPALGLPTATAAFAANRPAAYVQGYGRSGASYDDYDISLFVQDDWTVSDRLTVKAGLRYQKQFGYDTDFTVSAPGGGTYTYQIPEDNNNIAPRLAVVFDPTGNGRSSIHGSYGLFYDNHILANAQIAEGIDGVELRTLVQTIQTGAVQAWLSPGRRIPEPTTPYPSLVIAPDPGLETPFSHQASVGYDRAFGSNMAVSADVLYVRGYNQLGTIDYNPVVTALGPGRRPNDRNNAAGVPTAGTSASILQYTSFGETEYKGLTLALNRRLANRFQYLVSYTLSKAEDTSTDFQSNFIVENNGRGRDMNDPTGLPIGFDPDLERGAATHDQRHRLVVSGLYQAPFGINLSTIITAASGRPYTPLAGADLNGDGNGGAFPPDRARTTPADPTTSVKRNSETMDGQFNIDARLSKRFSFGPSFAFEAIVDVFNLTDRVNYTEINNIFGTGVYPTAPIPTYGLYEQALPGRQFQLGAKFVF